jgi:DNA-directed DNA polymerase III PolC
MSKFINLHLHSDGSLRDSPAQVKQIIAKVKAQGHTACAITDHGSMLNAVYFHKEALKHGIKPIIGMECYTSINGIADIESTKELRRNKAQAEAEGVLGRGHLILLAKNYTGYQNLCRLSAIAVREGFYHYPRIDYDLVEQYHEGLICTTACMYGDFFRLVQMGDLARARALAVRLMRVFGPDFYIEIQNHSLSGQQEFLPKAWALSHELGIPLVATNDAHFINKEDWKLYRAFKAIGQKRSLYDPDFEEQGQECWMKDRSDLDELFPGKFNQALDNTFTVAAGIDVYDLEPQRSLLPKFTTSESESLSIFKDLCRQGWQKYLLDSGQPFDKDFYSQRLKYETGVIADAGFIDYFLIVQDFIRFAKSAGIVVGPGRGSAAGSLVSFLLGITEVDPIKYGLMFERFLVPGRPSLPDIDIDVSNRDPIIAYLISKYGEDKVAPIINLSTWTCKSALIRVAGAMDRYAYGLELSKMIEKERGMSPTFEDALAHIPALKAQQQNNQELFELAIGLENVVATVSGHAAGVVISSEPISSVAPFHRAKDIIYEAYDKKSLSSVKLVKFDLLKLDTLSMLQIAIEFLAKKGIHLDLNNIPMNDSDTWNLICKGDTVGVFQFESAMMSDMLRRAKPRNLNELAVINAIGRPAGIDAGDMVGMYVNRKLGAEVVSYSHPILEPILKETLGLMVYQEQMMQISRTIAGLSIIEADKLRKATSDKDKSIIEELRNRFMSGASENGYPEALAKSLYDQILLFGGYGFNHCLTKDTKVVTINRGALPIIDVAPGDCVWAVEQGTPVATSVMKVHNNGLVSMVQLEFEDGSKESCSMQHKWLTPIGKRTTEEILRLDLPVWSCQSGTVGHRSTSEILSQMSSPITGNSGCYYDQDQQPSRLQGKNAEDFVRNCDFNIKQTRNFSSTICSIGKVAVTISRKVSAIGAEIYSAIQGTKTNYNISSGTTNQGFDVFARFYASWLASLSRFGQEMCRFCKSISAYCIGNRWSLAFTSGSQDSQSCFSAGKRQDSRRGDFTSSKLDSYKSVCRGHFNSSESFPKEGLIAFGTTHAFPSQTRTGVYRKVIRVIELGLQPAYDLEVSSPAHNFVLESGLCTSNSHSMAYSILAYRTAYLKAHFPEAFFYAYLNLLPELNGTTPEDFAKFISDAEAHKIKVLPPDIQQSGPGFEFDESGCIRYGLVAIKGIAGESLTKWLTTRPFANIDDALLKAIPNKVSIGHIHTLADVGAFQSMVSNYSYFLDTLEDRWKAAHKALKPPRKVKPRKRRLTKSEKRLLEEMKAGLESLEGTARDIRQSEIDQLLYINPTVVVQEPYVPHFDYGDLEELSKPLTAEQICDIKSMVIQSQLKLIGVTLSGTLLDDYADDVRTHAQMLPTWFIHHAAPDSVVKVAGVITSLYKKPDRHGRDTAFIGISEGRSIIRGIVFASTLSRLTGIERGKACVFIGKKDRGTLIINEIKFLRKRVNNSHGSSPQVAAATESKAS